MSIEIHSVLDTNVLIDILSCHDLTQTYEKLGPNGTDSPEAVFRRARARESLLLAIYFHKIGAATYSLHDEPLVMLAKRVDPNDDSMLETHYTKMMTNFVAPQVLAGWQPMRSDTPSHETGNEADGALIAYAKANGHALITNEGFTREGYSEGRIAKRARAEGVEVFFPRDVYRTKMDEGVETRDFIRRFRELAPAYIQAHSRPDILRATLNDLDGYFRHILLGEAARGAPVRTSVE